MGKAIKSVSYVAFQVSIILFAIVFLLKWINAGTESDDYGSEASEMQGTDRNERSIPRSFILPATPAVAFEQERQNYEKALPQFARCVGMLRNLGYEVGDSEILLNAKIVEAVYTFQVKYGLRPSGRLDQATMRAIKCS